MIYTAIILACFLIALTTSLLLAHSYHKVGKKYRGIREWIIGIIFHTVGLVISMFSDSVVKDFTVPISGFLIMVGILCLVVGIDRFFERFVTYVEMYVMILLSTLLIIYFNTFNYQLIYQIISLNITVSYITFRGSFILFKVKGGPSKNNTFITASFMTIVGIFAVLRIINAFFIDYDVATYHLVNAIDYTINLVYYILFTILAMNFNLLVSDKAWQSLSSEQTKFKTIFSRSPHAMLMISYETDLILDVNDEFIKQLEYEREDLVGKHYTQAKAFSLIKDRQDTKDYHLNKREIINKELPILKESGELMHSLLSISIVDELEEKLLIVSLTDITEIYDLKEKLDRYAYYDSLTELPNRRLFLRQFNSKLENKESFAIVAVDLDDFKQINDLYGHDMGDEVLKQIGERLSNLVSGTNFAARYGGDEFVLLLEYHGYQEELTAEIQKVAQALKNDFIVGNHSLKITASIGTAIYPIHGDQLKDLMSKADIAMYQVKHFTKDNLKIFEE